MAITLKGATAELYGEKDDTKPTEGVAVNTIFHELDTNDSYYFDGTAWQKIGGAANEG